MLRLGHSSFWVSHSLGASVPGSFVIRHLWRAFIPCCLTQTRLTKRHSPLPLILLTAICLAGCKTTEVVYTELPPSAPVQAIQLPADRAKATASPVIMMLVDEKNMGSIPTAEVEAAGMGLLLEYGCKPVDQDMLRASMEQRKRLLKMVGDNRGAAAVGNQFGADIVIAGSAVCKSAARRIEDSNIRNYQAVVTLRAIRTDNGNVLATASETGTALDVEDVRGGSKALRTAAGTCFDSLIPKTLNSWERGDPGATVISAFPHHVQVTFGGVDQLWKVKALREKLRALDVTDSVVQRSYTAGAVIFEADASQAAEELAETLVLDPPEGLKLQALSIEAGRIVFKVTTG